jgi:hypothetical protein
MGTASEEVEVQLPHGVKIVVTEGFSKAFEYEGDITGEVVNRFGKDGWPRPYLVFVVDGRLMYKFFKLPEDYEELLRGSMAGDAIEEGGAIWM